MKHSTHTLIQLFNALSSERQTFYTDQYFKDTKEPYLDWFLSTDVKKFYKWLQLNWKENY